MPRRSDLESILVIGAGPIVIGQACEFDYSGSQACKALKEEGYRVILVNSNPATIMTDPDMADKTYIEPVIPEVIRQIVIKEKPDAILPTVGGQTGLNAVVEVAKDGFLDERGIELIGADIKAIEKAENREVFKKTMENIGLSVPRSGMARTFEEAASVARKITFPVIIRASYTLGGTGGSIAYNMEEFKELAAKGIKLSLKNEIIVEESIVGWREYELEVMRDRRDNVVIICSIENVDPVGIHTGDSITVAPQQTLSDAQYQDLRDASIKIIREIGVSTGGSNIQFAVHPETGKMLVIEMNPRVSRSSALASKATGFPIAKIAAKLAIGYTLDEIPNDITRITPASFEPMIDYVVTKIPRFAFEKFRASDPYLGIQMNSVGETMSLSRTFNESFQKAIRGLETGNPGWEGCLFSYQRIGSRNPLDPTIKKELLGEKGIVEIKTALVNAHYQRLFYLKDAFYAGLSLDDLYELTKIDKWFLHHFQEIWEMECHYRGKKLESLSDESLLKLKENGFSDVQIAYLLDRTPEEIRQFRKSRGCCPTYKAVDTCSAEFEARTPYYYSTYDEEGEIEPSSRNQVVILGGGPNRIGQGIEFDYMCVQASLTLKEMGIDPIMMNSNPETVSTDYDISSVLFFEPITYEDVMNVIEQIHPMGVIAQLGGQTPLNISMELEKAGVRLLGTSAKNIRAAEDRDRFKKKIEQLGFHQPESAVAYSVTQCLELGGEINFPLIVRPSFVLGGQAMRIVYDETELRDYVASAVEVSPDKPILLDCYLENAVELDVDGICDGEHFQLCGIMEHVEEAGVHSGDSACIMPPQSIPASMIEEIISQSRRMTLALNIIGFINIQFAIQGKELFFLEVNPRGSRTIPFVCKTTGVPWVKVATQVMLGKKLKDIQFPENKQTYIAVKEVVLPFDKFPKEDTILGPEMKSTGEVMGLGENVGQAFAKAQAGAGSSLPLSGGLLVTVNTRQKPEIIDICRQFATMGFKLYATEGTGEFLRKEGVKTHFVHKLEEGRPDIRDIVLNREVVLILNTPIGREAKLDDNYIRLLASQRRIPIATTIASMQAMARAVQEQQLKKRLEVKALQDYYQTYQTGKDV